MKQILFSVLLAFSAYVHAQDTSFARVYEPVSGELGYNFPVADAALVWDEGLISIGTLNGETSGFIVRNGSDGNQIWQKECLSNLGLNSVFLNEVKTLYDSSFVVAGTIFDPAFGALRPICMKLNADGDTLWTRNFALINEPIGNYGLWHKKNGHVIQTNDSTILMGFHHSSYQNSITTPDHLCLSKLTTDGSVLWSKSFLADSSFYLSAMMQAMDSSIYLVGHSDSEAQNDYSYLINLSNDGQINWMRRYEGVQLHDIEVDSTYLYLGWSSGINDAGTMKLLLNGDHQDRVSHYSSIWWETPIIRLCRRSNGNIIAATADVSSFEIATFVELNENLEFVLARQANMIMSGVTSIPGKGVYVTGYGPIYGVKLVGDAELGVVRLDSLMNGNSDFECSGEWNLSINLYGAVPTSSAAFSASDSLQNYNMSLVHQTVDFVSAPGCVTFLGSVDEIAGSWNETVSPNPSNGEFTISWNEYRDAELVIFNSIGKEVYRTTTKNSFIEIDLGKEQNGLYYYQLHDSDGSQSSGKLSLMK